MAGGWLERRRRRALERRIVWVLGSPRTGSTWLVSMLAAEGRAIVLDEPTVGVHLGVLMTDYVSTRPVRVPPDRLRVNELRGDLDTYFFSRRYEPVWRPLLRGLLLGRLSAEARDVASHKSLRNPPVLIKEPVGSQGADLLLAATPGSRLLFLLRDGRDVIDSELDAFSRGGWAGDRAPGFATSEENRLAFLNVRAHAWLCRTLAVERAYESHADGRRLRVRYEDLLADTAGQLERIDAWLGIGTARERLAEIAGATEFGRIPARERGPGSFARAARPGAWRENLDSAEQSLVEQIMGWKLRELGYE